MMFRFFWENWRSHGFSSQDDTAIQLEGHQAKVCKECILQDVCASARIFKVGKTSLLAYFSDVSAEMIMTFPDPYF